MKIQIQLATAAFFITNIAMAATPVSKTVTPDQFAKIAASNASLILGTNEKTTKDPVSFDLTLKSVSVKTDAEPSTLFTAIRAQAPKRHFVSEHYAIDESYGLLTASEDVPGATPSTIFDLESDVVANEADPTQADVGMYGYLDQQYQVLSIVGSIVSYRIRGDFYGPGAAHPDNTDTITSIDLMQKEGSTFAQANLLDLVDENSLVVALKADKFVNSKLNAKYRAQLKRARYMQEVGDALDNGLMDSTTCYNFSLYDGKISNFAIYDFNATKNLVEVRITMEAAAHVCAGAAPTVELGLSVKPHSDLQLSLEDQAKLKSGLLMKNVK